MIKLKWTFPDINYDKNETNKTLTKMKKYGLHANDAGIRSLVGR